MKSRKLNILVLERSDMTRPLIGTDKSCQCSFEELAVPGSRECRLKRWMHGRSERQMEPNPAH